VTEKTSQKGPVSGSPPDPFATAKSNLRDTIKWLATTFAALVAVIMAGSTLTGISQIHRPGLFIALLGGLAGLICVILATGVMLRLLTSESFHVSELLEPANASLLASLNRHSRDILPPGYDDVAEFLELRRQALDQAKLNLRVRGSLGYLQAVDFLEAITEPLSRLANLAQFEKMRKAFDESLPTLWWLALGAILGLGVFALFAAAPAPARATPLAPSNPGIPLSQIRHFGGTRDALGERMLAQQKWQAQTEQAVGSLTRANGMELTVDRDAPLGVDAAIGSQILNDPLAT
jgi:hypothetical protein